MHSGIVTADISDHFPIFLISKDFSDHFLIFLILKDLMLDSR